MLCAIREKDQKKVIAKDEVKENAPFLCPGCLKTVTLKKGQINVHHFAHRPPVTCAYGIGEKEVHRKCKTEIYEYLMKNANAHKVELERNLKTVRPDVSGYRNRLPVTIEVQTSSLSVNEIMKRTIEYNSKRIFVLWVAEWNSKLSSDQYSPRAWERWVHDLYFGRVYYWTTSYIVPYHFAVYYLSVEEASWYTEDGEEEYRPGYERPSIRYVTLIQGKPIALTKLHSYFRGRRIGARETKKFNIPPSSIYIDNLAPWWK